MVNHEMTEGKPKVEPIKAMKILVTGSIVVQVKSEDFIDIITGKGLEVIQGRVGVIDKYYVYIAVDKGITYYTRSPNKIPEITVDIITEVLYLSTDRTLKF